MKINKVKLAKGILRSVGVIASLLIIYGFFSLDIIAGFALLGGLALIGLVSWCLIVLEEQ